jgi:hypothetical protein
MEEDKNIHPVDRTLHISGNPDVGFARQISKTCIIFFKI